MLKEYNIKRHYETKHFQNYSKYTGNLWKEKSEALKCGLKSQQYFFAKDNTEQEAATHASSRVALEIAKRGKPFIDGEMIKECIFAIAEEMCPKKVNLFKTVSLSAKAWLRGYKTSQKIYHLEWFSLALMSQRMCQILLRC